ncbi:hypothetical protein D3C71_1397950 [compost metagenome]
MHAIVQQRGGFGVGQPQDRHVVYQNALDFAVQLLTLFVGRGGGGGVEEFVDLGVVVLRGVAEHQPLLNVAAQIGARHAYGRVAVLKHAVGGHIEIPVAHAAGPPANVGAFDIDGHADLGQILLDVFRSAAWRFAVRQRYQADGGAHALGVGLQTHFI